MQQYSADYETLYSIPVRSLMINILMLDDLQLNLSSNWQEWVTVFGYLGLTAVVIWGVFTAQKK
ncbi:hypothetical protein HCG51_25420 [Tolypothrix sp. PCC 7910]|uniref:hypothetical protein n=1 Tax=Tolypothrix sp. PCC 7910 TaxID=2099387 RepID=UPI0014278B88|nr:hypothetical protein [Tolypothrix sp. PCC 7910]QIR35284.1 hypothetical protein HCG51_25420 [Tolypothrix sp. PCC 7910]